MGNFFGKERTAHQPQGNTTGYGLKSFHYEAALIWNSLLNDTRTAESYSDCRRPLHIWDGSESLLSDKGLLFISKSLGVAWWRVCIDLDQNADVLDSIKNDHKDDTVKQGFWALRHWRNSENISTEEMEKKLIRSIADIDRNDVVDLLVNVYKIDFDYRQSSVPENSRMTVTSIGQSSRDILPPVSNTNPRDTEPEREYKRTVSSTPTVIHVAEARISNDESNETSSEDEGHCLSDDRSLEFRYVEDVDNENVDKRSRNYPDSESDDVENENDDKTSESYPDTDDMENENVDERSRNYSDSESEDMENENDDETSESYPDTDDMENENDNDPLFDSYLTTMEAEDKYFFETKGYERAREVLELSRYVTITGNPGSGKTSIAFHLLLMYRKNGFSIRQIHRPNEFSKTITKSISKLVIFIDDIFGADIKENEVTKEWLNICPWIISLISQKKQNKKSPDIFLIMTSRLHILEAVVESNKTDLLHKETIVNLSEDSFKLNQNEKYNILKNILDFEKSQGNCKFDLSHNDLENYSSEEVPFLGFPFCAKQFIVNGSRKTGKEFFKRPFDTIFDILTKMIYQDQDSYGLFLIILFQDDKNPIQLNDPEMCRELFHHRNDLQEFAKYISRRQQPFFVQKAKSFEQSFLTRISHNKWKFSHPCIREAVSIIFAKNNLKIAIEVMDVETCLQRVKIESEWRNEESTFLYLDSSQYKIFAKRLVTEIENGNVRRVSQFSGFEEPNFSETFTEIVKQDHLTALEVCDRIDGGNFIYWCAYEGNFLFDISLINILLTGGGLSNDKDEFYEKQILFSASIGACQKLHGDNTENQIQFLNNIREMQNLMNFCPGCLLSNDRRVTTEILPSKFVEERFGHICLLEASVIHGNSDVMKFLLQQEATIPHCIWTGWDFLHNAALKDDNQICNISFIKEVMKKYGTKLAGFDQNPNNRILNPYDCIINPNASESHKEKQFLDMFDKSTDLNSFFLYCLEHFEMKEQLFNAFISAGVDVTYVDNQSGRNAFHFVAKSTIFYSDDTILERIDRLFKSKCQVDLFDSKGLSPLMIAMKTNKSEAVISSLLNCMDDCNIKNSNGYSALHFVVEMPIFDDAQAARYCQKLLENKANIETHSGKTPVTIAIDNIEKRTETLKVLLREQLNIHNYIHYCLSSALSISNKIKFLSIALGENFNTALRYVVSYSPPNLELVEKLVECGCTVNCIDEEQGTSLLHQCIDSSYDDNTCVTVINLLKRGKQTLDVDRKFKDLRTPLMCAVSTELPRFSTIATLVESGADVNAIDRDGFSAIHLAILSTVPSRYQNILYLLPSITNVDRYINGRTLLHMCILSTLSDIEVKNICEKLVNELRANIDLPDADGNNTITLAISSDLERLETLVFLLCNCNLKGDEKHKSLLLQLLKNRKLHHEIIDILKARKYLFAESSKTIFLELCEYNGHLPNVTKICRSLKECGFDINYNDRQKKPIHVACYNQTKDLSFIEELIAAGADVKAVDSQQRGCLYYCIESYRSDTQVKTMISSLIDKGADVDEKDNQHKTPLHHAILYSKYDDYQRTISRVESVRVLIEKGAAVNALDRNNFTSVHHCVNAEKGDYEAWLMLKEVLNAEPDLTIINSSGKTALNLAASNEKYSRILCIRE